MATDPLLAAQVAVRDARHEFIPLLADETTKPVAVTVLVALTEAREALDRAQAAVRCGT